MREAQITARLEHPAIIPIHDIGRHDSGEPYLCMKLVDGTSLHELVRARPQLRDRIALLPHVVSVAEALAYAHDRGVVHRDLKPNNVLVGAFGETVVIDWGLAKDLHVAEDRTNEGGSDCADGASDADLTRTGEFVGTLAFMPPEQALGSGSDRRADVYAIGAILYFVLSNRLPYEQADPRERLAALLAGPPTDLAKLVPAVPADLLAIVRKAMARAPEERYTNAQELAVDLRRFQEGRLVAARTYSTRELFSHFVRRQRTLISLAAASVTLVVLFGVYSYARIMDEKQVADEQRVQAVAAQEAEKAARTFADARAGEVRAIAIQQLIEAGRRDLFERGEPQRALVKLAEAYGLDDSRADLRRMLHEATVRGGNLHAMMLDVTGFRYSSSGDRLVLWHEDGTVSVWDTLSGTRDFRFSPAGEVEWAAFVPGSDERLVVGTSRGTGLYLRTVREWSIDAQATAHEAILPDANELVLLTSSEGPLSVDLRSGAARPLPDMSAPRIPLYDRAVWFRGHMLTSRWLMELGRMSEHSPTRVTRYDRSGRPAGTSSVFYRNMAHSLVMSPDGRSFSYVRDVDHSAAMLDDIVNGRSRVLAPCGEIDVVRDEKPDPTAAFSPDGVTLYRLVSRRQLARWNTRTLACEVVRTNLDDEYDRLAVSGDGMSVVLVSKRDIVSVLSAATLSTRARFNADTRPIAEFAVHPHVPQLAVLNVDRELRLWRLDDPRELAAQPIGDVARGPEVDSLIVTAEEPDGATRLRVVRSGHGSPSIVEMPFAETTRRSLVYSERDHPAVVAVMGWTGQTYELWSVGAGRRISTQQARHDQAFWSAKNDIMLASISPGHTPELWLPPLEYATTTPNPRGLVVVEGEFMNVRLYDLSNGAYIAALRGNYANFSPDGRFVFASSSGDDLYVFDANTGAELLELLSETRKGHVVRNGDAAVTFSPDGQVFAFSHNDGAISLWDAQSFARIATLHGHHDWARRLLFSPSSEQLVSIATAANSDGQTFLWDLESRTGQRIEVGEPTSVSFRDDGELVAFGDEDGVVRLWDTRTGGQVEELRGHADPVWPIVFTADGRLLTAASGDRVILWQLEHEQLDPVALARFTREVVPPDLFSETGDRRPETGEDRHWP